MRERTEEAVASSSTLGINGKPHTTQHTAAAKEMYTHKHTNTYKTQHNKNGAFTIIDYLSPPYIPLPHSPFWRCPGGIGTTGSVKKERAVYRYI